ncbi:MAG: hypothetical protein WA414_08865 [Acidobacteriaceae bacterium]
MGRNPFDAALDTVLPRLLEGHPIDRLEVYPGRGLADLKDGKRVAAKVLRG